MKCTYVGVAERKTIELSQGNLLVMEKGVAVEVPDEIAQRLRRTPGYQCDSAAFGPMGYSKEEKADAKAAEKAEKAADKAAEKAERAAEKAADKA